ncbi:MAG: hypothetical protein JWM16_1598 [Verrucomicrobiales bacterium]|nr:hypothetical protein [Verrucomicrobiales bacterium]
MCILQGRRAAFAEGFYRFHERRTQQTLYWAAVQIGVATILAAIGFWQLFYGKGVLLPGLFTAAFLVLLVSSVSGTIDQLRVRVIPYFETRVGDVDTWLSGKSLLWHSRDLDELSEYLSIRPLSSFVSGDDLVQGEELQFFDPNDALPTLDKLITRSKASRFPKQLVSDLTKLRDALKSASEKQVRFCLILREGTTASGHEMSLRKGSFF